jgi:hypothetical protein
MTRSLTFQNLRISAAIPAQKKSQKDKDKAKALAKVKNKLT